MYNLSQISKAINAQLEANILADVRTQPSIDILLTDSRNLTYPDVTLFFALVTAKGDGHKYISQLYKQGVRAFVVNRTPEDFEETCPEAWFLVVKDTLKALQSLAAFHRSRFSVPVVGITGSNGKTIVKEWLYQLLHDTKDVVRSPRSYNSQIGVPLSVWQLHKGTELAIFEAGISQVGEMENLEPIIRPTIGVLTNVGSAHDAGFENLRHKLLEKLQLFKHCKVLIYNADIPDIGEALKEAEIAAKSLSWTLNGNDAEIVVDNIEHTESSSTISYNYAGKSGQFTINMTDDASIENALNCLALMLYLGETSEDIGKGMQKLAPLAMRLEVVEGKRGCLIINDAYSCDLTSLEMALQFQSRRASKSLRNTLILSDMLQAGLDEGLRCIKIAQLCQAHNITKLINIGAKSVLTAKLLREEFKNLKFNPLLSFFNSTEDFLHSAEFANLTEELVLLKGARKFQFEKICDQLELRKHETILEVNLDAVVHNLNQYRSHLKSDTKIVCMVKAFGYGAGSFELAKTLQDHNVDYLAVAVADEGADLRRQGIRVPILVMNPEMTAFRAIIENQLEPEIYSFRLLRAFIAETEKMGVMHYPVHIKIDSGMHRLGFQSHEIEQLISELKSQNAVTVRSVFSHFATADCPDQEEFVFEQKCRFAECADRICEAFSQKILRHICNSAGIEKYPQFQMEMCRLGIGLYGFEASEIKMNLQPVATLKTTILQIKDIPETETVGYSRKGKLSRPSRIAMIPIGYADGFNRRLGNGNASMIVCGKRCPTVGNVCMDVTFLDVTDCPMAQEGDSVEIFGTNLPVTELSETLGTICYEVLSTISTRVKRVYFKE